MKTRIKITFWGAIEVFHLNTFLKLGFFNTVDISQAKKLLCENVIYEILLYCIEI